MPPAPAPMDEARLAQIEDELRRTRKEAIDASARASAVDRKMAEAPDFEPRLAALESDLGALRKHIAQSTNRLREELRRELEKFEAERRRVAEDLQSARQALDVANQDKASMAEKAVALQEQVDRSAARTSGRIESVEKELAEAKAIASEASALREASQQTRAQVEELEAIRAEQDRQLKAYREQIADLEEKVSQTAASPPPSEPVSKLDDELFPDSQPVVIDPDPSAAEPEAQVEEEVSSPAEPAGSVFDPDPVREPDREESPPVESVPVGDGATEAAKAALDPKNIFGPDGSDGRPTYVLLDLISEDELGPLYRAYARESGSHFAVRFLPAQPDEESTAALEQEVQKLVGIPHPNILPVLGSGRREGSVYVEMDLVRGETLRQVQVREIPRICMIFRDAADAIHYMNEDGVVHGAVSPESLLLGLEEGGDHAVVRDFGLGHLLETLHALPGAKLPSLTVRNPAYQSPEQMKEMRRTLDVSADVYGLGATLYFALAGRPPFEGKDVRQVRSRVMMEEPPPLETVRRDVPAALAVVVRRAMAKEPKLRYATARQFSEALTGFLEGRGTKVLSRPDPSE